MEELFETNSAAGFYWGLAKRYRKHLFGLAIFLLIFSFLGAGRLASVGLIADAFVRGGIGDATPDGSGAVAGFQNGGTIEKFEQAWEFVFRGTVESPIPDLTQEAGVATFLYSVVLGLAVVSLLLGLFFYLKEVVTISMVTHMLVDTRKAVFDHLTAQSVSFFHEQRSGDLTSRVTHDVDVLQGALQELFRNVIQQPFVMASALALAFASSPIMALCSLPLLIVIIIPIFRSGKRVLKHGRRRQKSLGIITEALQQLFSGIRIVKAFGMEDHERDQFGDKNSEYGRSFRKTLVAKVTGRSFQEVLYNLGFTGLLMLGGWMILEKQLTLGSFLTFILAMIQVYTPIKAASKAWNRVQESRAGVERVLELMHTQPIVQDRADARDFPGLSESITFDKVKFSYRDVPGIELPAGVNVESLPAINELSLRVKRGQVVALVGPSGSGKSTLVDLLARFYETQDGAILLDGSDIREFRHRSFLENIAIVSQDPFLFNTSIRQNIRYGREDASDEEIEAAAKAASAHEFILEQPEGYDTEIGDRGAKLSGGQRQRLTIARALLKNAPILILDEATSALDTQAEREVQRAIEALIQERTTFVIAHRLSTIVNADVIVVLDHGRIIEQGTHAELKAAGGRYLDLYNAQSKNS